MTMTRRPIVIGAVVSVAVVAALILRTRGESPAPTATSAILQPAAAVEPTTNALPMRDPAEAVDAAESVIRQTGDIATAGFITRTDLIRSLATERFGPVLAAQSSGQLSEMTETLGAARVAPHEIVWAEYPLASKIVSSTADVVVVAVWAVLVVGVPDAGAPRQVWRTVTVTMRWEGDAWRIDGWAAAAGPTPALASTATISSVADIVVVADWTPARAGGGS